MRLTIALLALASGVFASPTTHLKPRQANNSSTWPFLPAMKQFIADYEAGKTMNWAQVSMDTGLWYCQAQYIAQGGTGVKPAAASSASASKSSSSSASVSASKSASASASSSSAAKSSSSSISASASKSGSSSIAAPSSASKSGSSSIAASSPASKSGSSSIAASASASKSASSSPSIAGVQPAAATPSSSSKAAVPSSSSASSAKPSSATSSSAKPSTSSSVTPTSSVKPSTTSSVAPTSSSKPPASSSSSSAAPAATQDTVNKAQFLTLHNNFRTKYGAASVTWNDTLAAYAFKAASTCNYGHTNGPYGENIAAGVGGGYTVNSGFTSWSNESTVYNWTKPGYSDATGHFTQIVWKSTTQIGCAAVSCPDNTIFKGYGQPSTYLVCEYFQPGNLVDPSNSANTAKYFTDNVGKLQA